MRQHQTAFGRILQEPRLRCQTAQSDQKSSRCQNLLSFSQEWEQLRSISTACVQEQRHSCHRLLSRVEYEEGFDMQNGPVLCIEGVFVPSHLMEAGVQRPSAPHTELLSPLLHMKLLSHANMATLLYVVAVTDSRMVPPAEAGSPQSTTEAPARTGFNHVVLARRPSVGITFTGGVVPAWVEGLFSILDSISQLAAAFKAAWKVCAPSSVSAQTWDSALINICTGNVTSR